MEDEAYREDTYAATGSKVRVVRRIQTIYNLILGITGGHSNDTDRRLFTEEERKQLYEASDKKCAICGNLILSLDDCEIDHIIPFAKGGKLNYPMPRWFIDFATERRVMQLMTPGKMKKTDYVPI